MAWIDKKQRSDGGVSARVVWRRGGARDGAYQSETFSARRVIVGAPQDWNRGSRARSIRAWSSSAPIVGSPSGIRRLSETTTVWRGPT
jgi:hypothetical protein